MIALSPTDKRKNNNVIWNCLCDCGKRFEARSGALQSGSVQSCGHTKKLAYGESSFNHLYDKYKRGAKQRNLEFSLSKDEFRELTKQACHYCGIPPKTVITTKDYFGEYIFNGLDRVDNKEGYTKNNVVPCCKECNFAKRTSSYLDFINWLSRFKDNNGHS